jgi:hypothetical protein
VVASELIVGAKASLKETEIVVFGLMVELFLTDIAVTASDPGAACDAVISTSVPKSDNDAAPTNASTTLSAVREDVFAVATTIAGPFVALTAHSKPQPHRTWS